MDIYMEGGTHIYIHVLGPHVSRLFGFLLSQIQNAVLAKHLHGVLVTL